jgi:hypothetical protein
LEEEKMKNVVTILMVVAMTVCAAHAAGPDLTTGLVAWWDFEDGAGTTVALDKSGNGHDLALRGASYSTGCVGNWALNTTDGYGVASTSPALGLPGSYTLSSWAFPTATYIHEDTTLFGVHWCFVDNDKGWALSLVPKEQNTQPTGGLYLNDFQSYANNDHISTLYGRQVNGSYDSSWGTVPGVGIPVFSVNQWYHLAITFDSVSNLASIYVDGVLVRQGPGLLNTGGSVAPFVVGTDHLTSSDVLDPASSRNFFQGLQDDIRIYDRALNTAEIQQLATPEPATVGLLALGGMLLRKRRV